MRTFLYDAAAVATIIAFVRMLIQPTKKPLGWPALAVGIVAFSLLSGLTYYLESGPLVYPPNQAAWIIASVWMIAILCVGVVAGYRRAVPLGDYVVLACLSGLSLVVVQALPIAMRFGII